MVNTVVAIKNRKSYTTTTRRRKSIGGKVGGGSELIGTLEVAQKGILEVSKVS